MGSTRHDNSVPKASLVFFRSPPPRSAESGKRPETSELRDRAHHDRHDDRNSRYRPLIDPAKRILPAHIAPVGLRRIAIDQRTPIERMSEAANLVLHREQRLVGI